MYYSSSEGIVCFGFVGFFEPVTSFIRWGISVAIICSKAQLSPWAPNMDLKLSIPKIKLSVVSPKPTILQISKKHHFYPIAQDKNLRARLDSSLPVPRLSNPSTHLSTCILTSPTPTLRHPGVHGTPLSCRPPVQESPGWTLPSGLPPRHLPS